VTVPRVTGDPAAGAFNALRAANLHVKQIPQTVTDKARNGIVVRQSPTGNTTANKGSTVTIVVGRYTPLSSSTTTSSSTTSSSSTTTTTTTTTSTSTSGNSTTTSTHQ
ncbi:MAG: PASTA domain-containing protein, partial [Solirubrobacteraceae bacterium]